MFFTTSFISTCLARSGFEKVETIEREPYGKKGPQKPRTSADETNGGDARMKKKIVLTWILEIDVFPDNHDRLAAAVEKTGAGSGWRHTADLI